MPPQLTSEPFFSCGTEGATGLPLQVPGWAAEGTKVLAEKASGLHLPPGLFP